MEPRVIRAIALVGAELAAQFPPQVAVPRCGSSVVRYGWLGFQFAHGLAERRP